jgi:hypothetical protein
VYKPNRDYNPTGYDKWFREGQLAARAGLPRELPQGTDEYAFAYGFPAMCWFQGYDVEKSAPRFEHFDGDPDEV